MCNDFFSLEVNLEIPGFHMVNKNYVQTNTKKKKKKETSVYQLDTLWKIDTIKYNNLQGHSCIGNNLHFTAGTLVLPKHLFSCNKT